MDLLLKTTAEGDIIDVVITGTGGPSCFQVPWPTKLVRQHQAWRRRYLAHHDPAGADLGADVVERYGADLVRSLEEWLQSNDWRPFEQEQRREQCSTSIRISFSGASTALEQLPWENMRGLGPIWRTARPITSSLRPNRAPHRPRLLLWIGLEEGLQLDGELTLLKQLQTRQQIELRILRGAGGMLKDVREALKDSRGFDALMFLGHSQADKSGGGRLQLSDGSWLHADELQPVITSAASRGLELVLLNSCSGLDLALSIVRFGVSWVVCYREPVRCETASSSFRTLISALQSNQDLTDAVATVREHLRGSGAAGSALLLSLVGSTDAQAYRLPLHRSRQWRLRWRQTPRQQWLAAGCAVVLGACMDLVPSNPVNHYLLDRRLAAQTMWRRMTSQPGPKGPALPVVVIDQHSDRLMGSKSVPNRVSRQTLATLLERTNPTQVPIVGIDVVLDEELPQTDRLADVIRRQQRRALFAGYFGADVEAQRVGNISKPLAELQKAGLKTFNLSTGLPTNTGQVHSTPLQLWGSIGPSHFAAQLSERVDPRLPADAVLDWSLQWNSLLKRVRPDQLPTLTAPALLIGTDGTTDPEALDLFHAPSAMDPKLSELWGGSHHKVPGVIVQAVLAQSINLGHWLQPMSTAFATALTAAAAIGLSGITQGRRERIVISSAIALAAIPLCLQLAVSTLWLVPLFIPLTSLMLIGLIRRD